MKVTLTPLSKIKPYRKNPRRNEEAIEDVKTSIQEFGWNQPIVVDTKGVIIVGHTRYFAALELHETKVPVVVASHLSPGKARQYRLADNRTGENAGWNFDLLVSEMKAIDRMTKSNELLFTGFSKAEHDRLIGDDFTPNLQDLKKSAGEFEESALWPAINFQVPPPLYNKFEKLMEKFDGEPHERFAKILAKVKLK